MSVAENPVHPRFPFAATVMVRESRSGAAILAQLRNISLSGCYLETPRQMPPNGRVQVVLQTHDVRAHLWGVVRRCDKNGVGVQFTHGATVEDWKRLQSLIEELQSSLPAAGATAPGV